MATADGPGARQAPEPHSHAHGAVDPVIFTTQVGIRAVKRSFLLLLLTALIQGGVVVASGSVALLADTVHNLGDAATAVPLWFAFLLARRKPSPRFPYGYGRVEDLAGVAVVLVILASAALAAYESVDRFLHPKPVAYLGAVAAAALIGFLGNEAVARLRIRAGRRIGSAALTADGYHARADGLTSLGVLGGAAGMVLGYPVADPAVGLLISAVIFRIAWTSGKSVFTRLLDGIDPEVVDEIRRRAGRVAGVREVSETRVRWTGHRLRAEVNVAVDPGLPVEEAHGIATQVQDRLLHELPYLSQATIHVDPAGASGEKHHRPAGQGDRGPSGHAH